MPIRENLTASGISDGTDTHLATKSKKKSDDDDRIDFGAAFAAMLTPAMPSPPARVRNPSTREIIEPKASDEIPPGQETIAVLKGHTFDVPFKSDSEPAMSNLSFVSASAMDASRSKVTGLASPNEAPVDPDTRAANPEAAASVRTGFWSGLLRSAGLLSSARSGPKSTLTTDNQADTNEQTDSAKQAKIVAVDQSEETTAPGSKGLNPADNRQTSAGAPPSWLQLLETTAPLSEVPTLITKLSNQLSKAIEPAAKSEPLQDRADAAVDARSSTRPVMAIDSETRELNPVPNVVSKHQGPSTIGERVSTPATADRPSLKAPLFDPAARVTAPASSSKAQSSAILLSADKPTVPQRSETSVAAGRFAVAIPVEPRVAQSVTAPRSVAPTAQIHPSTTSSNLPVPSRTATLRLDLVEGGSAQASVRERAGVVDVRIVTNSAPLAQHLDGEFSALRRNLDANGLQLQSADVSYGGHEGGGQSGHQGEHQAPPRRDNSSSTLIFNLGEAGK